MKITFITDTMHSGGAERVISVLANYFTEKYKVEIVCLSGEKSFYSLKDSIKLTCLEPLYGKNLLKKLIWLFKNIKSDNLVIAFMVNVYIFTLVALFFKKVKVIVSERNDPTSHSLPIVILRRFLIHRANRIIVQTQDIADYFHKMKVNNVDIIYNPISERYKWKSALNVEKEKVIVTVGRLSQQKNHIMLINAFDKIHKLYPEYQLHIYGEGEIRKKIEKHINSIGLDGIVTLKGRFNNLSEVLPHAEIFVMSSDYEGMSNALIEAMYMGIPVVTTSVSGTKELINNGVNGFIVPIRNQKAFTEAIIKLIESKALRDKFASEEVNIINKVSPLIIFNQWENVINKVWKN